MSLFDSIKGSLGSVAASTPSGIIEKVFPGGLQGLLNQLAQSGYGKQVNSWLGRCKNEPISTDYLRNTLNATTLSRSPKISTFPMTRCSRRFDEVEIEVN